MREDNWYDPSELREMEIEAEIEKSQAKWSGLTWIAFWSSCAVIVVAVLIFN